MADEHRSRKRKRITTISNFLLQHKVEVRSIEEGFEGSWHSATVIDSKNQTRMVKYDNILSDDSSENFVESVPVLSDKYRGRIRPVPPQFKHNLNCLHYGQCVDVFHEEAWWDGVVFDHNDVSKERLVFFPDVGDELRVKTKNIRLSRDWSLDIDEWKYRGDWVFLEVLEELEIEWPILVSLKQIWYEVRMKKRFGKEIKEWTCKLRDVWKETVKEVVLDNLKLTMVEFFSRLHKEGHQDLDIKQILNSITKIEPSFFENLPVEDDLDDEDDDIGPPGFSKTRAVSDDQVYKYTEIREFCKFVPDLAVEPECCQDAIFQYYRATKRKIRPSLCVTSKFRQHLLYLGWKIELKKDFFGKKKKESFRYRYTDPATGKCHHSLATICSDSYHKLSDSTSLESYKPPPTPVPARTREIVEVDSEYCPQAVVDYHYSAEGVNEIDVRKLRSRAKKHLLAVGWSMWYTDETSRRKRTLYRSPNGKIFNSIRQACTHYMVENGSRGPVNVLECQEKTNKKGVACQEKTKEKGVGKLVIKKKDGVLSIQAVDKTKDKEPILKSIDEETGNSETGKSSRKTRVLRTSKRAREEISPMHQTPRTILSWLIDNSVLLPRSKVQYRCRKDGHTMKEGRVTRDGIKCSCCQTVFSISKFESHAGSGNRRPSANIFLEDGRSLLDCQLQLKSDQNKRLCKTEPRRSKGNRQKLINDNDYICTVCHYGGELVLCDQCPSSFHTHCLGITDVPDGDWFCPSCCCRVCNKNKFSDACEEETDCNILNCEQCERRYHIGCLKRKEGFTKLESYPQVNWFCSPRCEEIFVGLNKLLGKPIPVGRDDLTWTIVKHKRLEGDTSNTEELTEIYSKLNIAISVMHECFEPVKEPRTQRDIVEDVIFCRWSELNRLNFKGFYTILLEKDDELVSAASVRIYGEKVAELPLVGTRFRFRRRGMCHALVDELEKMLVGLGVERLVLPAVPSVLNTWTSSFGFSLMTESEKLNFLGYTFLDFQGTHMCQKSLMTTPPSAESSISRDNNFEAINGSNAVDLDHISAVSEVSQVERVEESGLLHQRPLDTDQGKENDNRSASAQLEILAKQTSHIECQSEISVECSMEATNVKEEDSNGRNGHIKCYQRRKTVSCGS
nr:agenet-like domain-containing protein [Tanacetum cinerariifolium]